MKKQLLTAVFLGIVFAVVCVAGPVEQWTDYKKARAEAEKGSGLVSKGLKMKKLTGKDIEIALADPAGQGLAMTSEALFFEYGEPVITSDPINEQNLNTIAEYIKTHTMKPEESGLARQGATTPEPGSPAGSDTAFGTKGGQRPTGFHPANDKRIIPKGRLTAKTMRKKVGDTTMYAAYYVDGHTCSIGSDENNCRLSWARANVVVQKLVDKGVDRRWLIPRGFGEAEPTTPGSNETEEGRRLNRRAVLNTLGGAVADALENKVCKIGAPPASYQGSGPYPDYTEQWYNETYYDDYGDEGYEMKGRKGTRGVGFKPANQSVTPKGGEPKTGFKPAH